MRSRETSKHYSNPVLRRKTTIFITNIFLSLTLFCSNWQFMGVRLQKTIYINVSQKMSRPLFINKTYIVITIQIEGCISWTCWQSLVVQWSKYVLMCANNYWLSLKSLVAALISSYIYNPALNCWENRCWLIT